LFFFFSKHGFSFTKYIKSSSNSQGDLNEQTTFVKEFFLLFGD
jgi:hypothetical protein